MKVWQVFGILAVLTAFLFAPALISKTTLGNLLQRFALFAYENTFSVSPAEIALDVYVGQVPQSTTFTVKPETGDFEYYPVEYVLFPEEGGDYCLEWNEYGACESYDFHAWAQDNLLCNFLTFSDSEDGAMTLQVPNDTEDTIQVSLSVPCHSGTCGMYDAQGNLVFPEELLDTPLTCKVMVGEMPQVSLAPLPAYAQEVVTDTVTITATVRTQNIEEVPILTLPMEAGYDGIRGVHSTGPYLEKGIADSDTFMFKVIYTHERDVPPETMYLSIFNEHIPLEVDTNAENPNLFDGSYVNGEQYTVSRTLPKGMFPYGFIARVEGVEHVLDQDTQAHLYTVTAGYSSIAFLPGLQASRLFEENEDDWFEDQLWEPNRDADARALEMKGDGTSLHKDIYTKVGRDGAIDEALGFTSNIYKSFLDNLEDWKTEDGLMRDYAVLPYDWRFAFDTILQGGTVDSEKLYFDPRYTTDSPHIYAELERLAQESDTGRVTIVAHSMGGLITKKLLTDLEDNPNHKYRHLLTKIDAVIFVATPQLGTPKAVASLLHGYGQELDIPLLHWPNFATAETLRRIARDMPSVYTLLPSPRYFDMVHDVGEDGNILNYTKLVTGQREDVTTYEEMRDFLDIHLGEAGDDLTIPMTPRNDYTDDAETLHERIDDWTPPDLNGDTKPDFTVVQIAGWGIQKTVKGIEYVEGKHTVPCEDGLTGPCTETYLDPRPVWTSDGDGTVVLPSAVAMGEESDEGRGVETWYVDMYHYNKVLTNYSRDHASILEVDSLLDFLQDKIQKQTPDREYIYSDRSNLSTPDPYLRISMHSPATVSLQNPEGFVGINTSGNLEESIGNAYYLEFGEGKYLGAPLLGEEYTVKLQGTGEGTFTFILTEEKEGKVLKTKTFTDVPVTESTQSTLTFSSLEEVTKLDLDTNGDGVTDATVYGDERVTFDDLKEEIDKLDTKGKKQLLQTVYLAERFSERGNVKVANLMLTILEKEVVFLSSKKQPLKMRIEKSDAERIISIIHELKETL